MCCDKMGLRFTWVGGVWGQQCVNCGTFFPEPEPRR